MERVSLASRAVVSACYDDATQTLELEFATGRSYRYDDVPRSVYEWLLRTPSKGAYVSRMINGRYAYRDVTPAPEGEGSACDLEAALRASLIDAGLKPAATEDTAHASMTDREPSR